MPYLVVKGLTDIYIERIKPHLQMVGSSNLLSANDTLLTVGEGRVTISRDDDSLCIVFRHADEKNHRPQLIWDTRQYVEVERMLTQVADKLESLQPT